MNESPYVISSVKYHDRSSCGHHDVFIIEGHFSEPGAMTNIVEFEGKKYRIFATYRNVPRGKIGDKLCFHFSRRAVLLDEPKEEEKILVTAKSDQPKDIIEALGLSP